MENPANPQPEQQTSAVHFLDYWRVLYARKEIVIAVALLVMLTGIVITHRMPRVYATKALIQVRRETPGTMSLLDQYGRYDSVFMLSQYEIIRSYPVIERVVREMKLNEKMGDLFGWNDSGDPQSVFEQTVSYVQRQTDLQIRRDTDLIEIRVRASRPEQPEGEALRIAVDIANTIAKVFEAYNKDENKRDLEEKLTAVRDELDEMGRQIVKDEEVLNEFRRVNNITMRHEGDRGLEALRLAIAAAADLRDRSELNATIKKNRFNAIVELTDDEAAIAIPMMQVTESSLITRMIIDKETLESSLDAAKFTGLGQEHPEVKRAEAALLALNGRIAKRIKDIKLALKLEFEQAQSEYDLILKKHAILVAEEREFTSGAYIRHDNMARNLASLKYRKASLESIYDTQRSEMKIPTTSVKLKEAARMPRKPLPISPNVVLNITLSIVVGLIFGITLAFFVEYLDTTVKSVDDVEKHLGTTIVGVVPNKIRPLNSGTRNTGHSEIYRVLRMNLKSSKKLGDGKILMITSASAGEGKSTTSFNLAYVCAEVGERTLLLDADLHRPVQHKILGIDSDIGLSNIIVGESSIEEAIQHTVIPNLDILPSGRMSRFSVIGLVDTDEMRNLIAELATRYDRIIMDTPPIIGVSDTAPLVRLADGVVQVVHHRKYPRGLCRRARDLITGMGGNLLGIILNNVESVHDTSSYYYKYQYYYYYYYASEDETENPNPNRSKRRRRASRTETAAVPEKKSDDNSNPSNDA